MAKAHVKILFAVISSLLLWGCGGKKSSSNNNGTSTTCLYNPYTGGCDTTQYNNYNQYGFSAYPAGAPGYSSNSDSPFRYQLDYYFYGSSGLTSQLCSCPQGSRPVYNGGLGIGCATMGALPRWAPIYYHGLNTISGPGLNNHYVNIPQVSNINGNYNNYGGCYSNVAWSCLLGQNNQCPSGSTCQATAQNSPIGVCIRQ